MQRVAGRDCGECSVCCVVLNVDTPEFQKMPQTACTHLRAGGGCAIHATRFPVCRAYHCGWRYLAQLSDDWRPDRSGILVDFQTNGLPANYPKRPGIRLTTVGPVDAIFQPGAVAFVCALVSADVPVVLSVPGPPGHFPAGAFVNDALREAVASADAAAVEAALRRVLSGLEGHSFNTVIHRHGNRAQDAANSSDNRMK